jgi:hypothetical protein
MDSIHSCLLYLISCFDKHLDDPYHVRQMMHDSPRCKYSDHELDTDSIVLDIDEDFSRTTTTISKDLNHRISRHKEQDEDTQYYDHHYVPKVSLKRAVRSWSSALYKTSSKDGDSVGAEGVGGDKGAETRLGSDMSEVVPIIGDESEESTVLHTFWRNIRGVMRDSIDEDDREQPKKENDFVLDIDTMVL